ncbi:flavin reductase family protein [Caulobacter sp. DWR2-3-1b2]|uniref:flavin reductase family protein n=1 Tax=unclassified Caulobacter TaxID=2648921 RepID=UPI003CF14546
MAFDADPRWLGDAAWPAHAWPIDASPGAEPPYSLHAPPVCPAAFKDALAQLASGVAIVSCWDGSAPRGLLVSSITGLSVDPPRFLFCLRKQASSHDALLRARCCGVAVLAEDDEAEALRFSTPGLSQERFEPGRWDLTPDAAPAYQGGLSTTACVIDHRIETGTHTVFIVSAIAVRSTPGRPLIVHARTFQRLGLAASSPKGL